MIAKTYAKENERTIHHGKISRIGGVAIYVSFIISMALFVKADMAVNGMILGGSLMFFAGLIDDLIDMKPLVKLAFEVCAAFILVAFGVGVDVLRFAFWYHNRFYCSFYCVYDHMDRGYYQCGQFD